MTKKHAAIIERLNNEYGLFTEPTLDYGAPHELLIATILSAQCTDDRVNMVTKDLYKKYPDVRSFAEADLEELMQDIFSTGFYRNKAKNIIACAKVLLEDYNGEVPSDIDLLVKLPGVGRKTANVVRGNIYNEPSIVVDTHVKRVSKLLGLTANDDPEKVEYDLMKVLPKEQWILFNIQVIAHGRKVCIARRPKCSECVLREVCRSAHKA